MQARHAAGSRGEDRDLPERLLHQFKGRQGVFPRGNGSVQRCLRVVLWGNDLADLLGLDTLIANFSPFSQVRIYDIEARAFRRFFALPDDEWKWHFDVPAFGLPLIALDFHHTSDFGST